MHRPGPLQILPCLSICCIQALVRTVEAVISSDRDVSTTSWMLLLGRKQTMAGSLHTMQAHYAMKTSHEPTPQQRQAQPHPPSPSRRQRPAA
jgi:hypothetical protein